MKEWIKEFQTFWKNKYYTLALILTAALGYGFLVTHGTIGIDDTPFSYYFEEGLAAIVGRWVLFLLNKVMHIAEFAPWITDLAGVLIFMAAVTVWCVLLRRIFGNGLPGYGYTLFACLFLSNPLLSEVFPYYLHNGVALGYLFCGISLCFWWEAMEVISAIGNRQDGLKERKDMGAKNTNAWRNAEAWKALGFPLVGSAVCLCVALGCYESFMVVWLLGICIILLAERVVLGKRPLWKRILSAGGTALAGMVLRSLMIGLVTKAFSLEYMQDEAVQRSLGEMASWMFQPGAASEFAMVLKRIFVMYGVFGYAYYPIAVFVVSAVLLGCLGCFYAVRKKDIWVLLFTAGCFVTSFLLVLVEGKATLYRSAQFLPVLSAWGFLFALYALRNIPRAGRWICVLVLSCVVWNQCADLNKWFYVDYLKYEEAKDTASKITYELEKNYNTDKPVIFTGNYTIPKSIIEDAYVDYGSETFYKMNRITSFVDEHLLEKFYREYGVWVAQTPSLSVIDWGRYAFGDDKELVRFFALHGHELKALEDVSLYEGAEKYSLTLPSFPAQGSIVDMGEYIIVHF